MNTEMFRKNVPDTIITHQFGRRTVAQSYEYDHRNLAEKLSFVKLPPAASKVLPAGSAKELVGKMVVSGMALQSHLGQSFKRIQHESGDEAAFIYLAANADGFHVTPYGFCTNTLDVKNMTCELCPVTVKKALEKTPGVAKAQIDFAKKTATVTFDPDVATVAALAQATTNAGYPSTAREVK